MVTSESSTITPTRLHCLCSVCGHQGVATLDRPARLRCIKCGSHDAVILARAKSEEANQRRGK